jgi:hypothetical protein
MTTTDVEEDLDVKSLSVVRVTYHAWSFVRGTGALGLSESLSRPREGVGSQLPKEVSGRAKLLTEATKMKEELGGEFR